MTHCQTLVDWPMPVLRGALITATVLLGALSPSLAEPGRFMQVLLMRHGHKDPRGSTYNLSEQGFQRAISLAGVIPACFGRPTHIITFNLDPESSKNARSYQTAVPLAVAAGVSIRIETASADSARVAGRILHDPVYNNGLVVIIWEHRRLPELAAALGWPAMPAIADDDFDHLDHLIYRPSSRRPVLHRYSQRALLAGSQPCTRASDL